MQAAREKGDATDFGLILQRTKHIEHAQACGQRKIDKTECDQSCK